MQKPRFEMVCTGPQLLKIVDNRYRTTVCRFDMVGATLNIRQTMGKIMVDALNTESARREHAQQRTQRQATL